MRFHCSHTTKSFLVTGSGCNINGNHPTIKIGFSFRLAAGGLKPVEEFWGLVDSGAGITSLPGRLIGWYDKTYPTDLSEPISVWITGVHGRKSFPAYMAVLNINGQTLNGPYCPRCQKKFNGAPCSGCHGNPTEGAFPIAAIPTLEFPLIGRDVLDNFLTIIAPFARKNDPKITILANDIAGYSLTWCLKKMRGKSLSL